jgi:rubrerythrin
MLEDVTPRKAVEFAVKTEEFGSIFYSKLSRKFGGDAELKEIFELLAKDEKVHEAQFRKLLQQVPADEHVSSQDDRYAYLRAMSMSQFFMGEEGLYKNLDEILDRNMAFVRAFELEKATLQYYQAMQEVLGENDVVSAIIAAEKSHLLKMMHYMLTDAKFRGLSDSF